MLVAPGIGSVLSHVQGGKEHALPYYSRALSNTKGRYCVLAIVASLEHLHLYLYGAWVLIRADHGALRWPISFKQPEGQMAHWIDTVQSNNYTLEHRAGRAQQNAYGLSNGHVVLVGIIAGRRELDMVDEVAPQL